MKFCNKLRGSVFSVLVLSAFAANATSFLADKDLVRNEAVSPSTLCSAHTEGSIAFVATFSSEEECKSYSNAVVAGSPNGVTYGNCTSSSYCFTAQESPLVGSLRGYDLAGVAAQRFQEATLEFPTSEDCKKALNGAISCPAGENQCNGNQLHMSGCYNSNWGGIWGMLSLSATSLWRFNFLPQSDA